MVSLSPFSRSIFACHPIELILLTSSCFFGVPFGLVISQLISPSNPINFFINCDKSLIDISLPVPTFKKERGSPFLFFGDFLDQDPNFLKQIHRLLPDHQHAKILSKESHPPNI